MVLSSVPGNGVYANDQKKHQKGGRIMKKMTRKGRKNHLRPRHQQVLAGLNAPVPVKEKMTKNYLVIENDHDIDDDDVLNDSPKNTTDFK